MITQNDELLQIAILRVLDANGTKFGLAAEAIKLHVGPLGFQDVTKEKVETELEYLQGSGLVEVPPKIVNPNLRTWKRTAAGRNYLAERGL